MNNLFKNYNIFNIDPSKLRSQNFYQDYIVNEREKFWEKRSLLNKKLEDNECTLCSNKQSNSLYLNHQGYQLIQCSSCNVIFANIKLDSNYENLIYDNSQYEESTKKEILDTFEYRKKTFGKERFEYINKLISFHFIIKINY